MHQDEVLLPGVRVRADGTDVQQLTDNQWEEGGPAWLPPSKK